MNCSPSAGGAHRPRHATADVYHEAHWLVRRAGAPVRADGAASLASLAECLRAQGVYGGAPGSVKSKRKCGPTSMALGAVHGSLPTHTLEPTPEKSKCLALPQSVSLRCMHQGQCTAHGTHRGIALMQA